MRSMVRRIQLVYPVVTGILIVLCHGEAQAQNISSWNPEWVQGLSVVVVLDKASSFQAAFPTDQIGAADVAGFRAGANRDKGLAWAMKHRAAPYYLFLDGDCVPGSQWQKAHAPLNCGEPLVTCGARTEIGKPDPRTLSLRWKGELYGPAMESAAGVWKQPSLRDIMSHRSLWSCNFGMTHLAAEILLEAGKKAHREPRIFYPGFDGLWGGEDTGLAILARLTGVEIRMNGQHPVEHIPHGPGAMTVKNLARIENYYSAVQNALS